MNKNDVPIIGASFFTFAFLLGTDKFLIFA